MEPIADAFGLPVTIDGRVIEAENYLEGLKVSFPGLLRKPRSWWYFRNVLRPTWGEPYLEVVARMRLAMKDAIAAAAGHEAVIVSHQLPIWMARCDAEGRRLFHDPRRRECTLASITSFSYVDSRVTSVSYREPAASLLRAHQGRKFVAGA
jgi:broad specificity phosphatase PhoE